MNFGKEATMLEESLGAWLKKSLAIYAVDMTVGPSLISPADGDISRNFKRGILWQVADEGVEELTSGKSNIRNQNWMKFVDESFFNSVVSLAAEKTNAFDLLDDTLPNVGLSPELRNSAVTALITMVGAAAGRQLEQTALKNITGLWK